MVTKDMTIKLWQIDEICGSCNLELCLIQGKCSAKIKEARKNCIFVELDEK